MILIVLLAKSSIKLKVSLKFGDLPHLGIHQGPQTLEKIFRR